VDGLFCTLNDCATLCVWGAGAGPGGDRVFTGVNGWIQSTVNRNSALIVSGTLPASFGADFVDQEHTADIINTAAVDDISR
jgi:hypothetical protein